MELLALLESGDIDYTIDYKSTVIQDGLQYMELPRKSTWLIKNLAQTYAKVVVKTEFRRFKTVDPVFQGLPIYYGMTIANNSKHQAAAEKFIQFVLSADGQRIFRDANQPELIHLNVITLVHYLIRSSLYFVRRKGWQLPLRSLAPRAAG